MALGYVNQYGSSKKILKVVRLPFITLVIGCQLRPTRIKLVIPSIINNVQTAYNSDQRKMNDSPLIIAVNINNEVYISISKVMIF